MPGPTLLTLRKWTYRKLGENASSRSTDSADSNFSENPNYPLESLDAAINAALDDMGLRLDHDCFKTSDTANAVNGEVTCPATYGSRLQLSFRNSSSDPWQPLNPVTEEWMDIHRPDWRTTTLAIPDGYFVKAKSDGTIAYCLTPQLSTTVTSGLLRKWVLKLGTLVAKTDTADILQLFPSQQFSYVPNMAAYFLVMNDSEDQAGPERASAFLAAAERDIAYMRMRLRSLSAAGFSDYRRR